MALKRIQKRKEVKAQSAMEYLISYGWAILVIAIILGILFSVGIFNTSLNLPTECIPTEGFLCNNPILSTGGMLTIGIGNAGGQQLNLNGVACSNSTTEPTYFQPISVNLQQGQSTTIQFQCVSTPLNIGNSYSGKIWLSYTNQLGQNQVVNYATFSAKVASASAPILYLVGYNNTTNYPTLYSLNTNNNTIIRSYVLSPSVDEYACPSHLAINPTGEFAYILDNCQGNIYKVNLMNGQISNVLTSPPCTSYGQSEGISGFLSTNGQYAYLECSGNVISINLSDGIMSNFSLTFNGCSGGNSDTLYQNYMYVNTNCLDNGMFIANISSKSVNAIVIPWPLTPNYAPAISSNSITAYFLDNGPNPGIDIVNMKSGITSNIPISSIGSGCPNNVVLAPSGQMLYVGDSCSGVLDLINLNNDQISTFPLPQFSGYSCLTGTGFPTISPNALYIYLPNCEYLSSMNLQTGSYTNIEGIFNIQAMTLYYPST